MKKIFTSLLILLLFPLIALAQKKPITGTVTSLEDNNALLPGLTIVVNETQIQNISKQPTDLKIDPAGQKLYFVNDRYTVTNGGGLWSVNLDGSGLTNIIPDLDAGALDLDIPNSKMYIAAFAVAGTAITADGIYMSNINGFGIQQIGNPGAKATWGIAHNHVRLILYWGSRASASTADGKIIQGNLDGGSQSDFLTQINPYTLTIVKI